MSAPENHADPERIVDTVPGMPTAANQDESQQTQSQPQQAPEDPETKTLAFLRTLGSSATPSSFALHARLQDLAAAATTVRAECAHPTAITTQRCATDGDNSKSHSDVAALASAFLQAVARQWNDLFDRDPPATSTTTAAAPSRQSVLVADPAADESFQLSSNRQKSWIIETVGIVSLHCTPRSKVTESGILLVLATVLERQRHSSTPNHDRSETTFPYLSTIAVEFLQVCVAAEQYRYASRVLGTAWPRPRPGTTVTQVLRYYYLRGIVHIGTNELEWAVRSFQTCVSVPAETVSAIAIAAWKRLVLVQCIRQLAQPMLTGVTPQAVKTMPPCLHRYLAAAEHAPSARTEVPEGLQPPAETETVTHLVEAPEETGHRHDQPNSEESGPSPDSHGNVKVYLDLVGAFSKSDSKAFVTLVTNHENILQGDGTAGLVRQVRTALTDRLVYDCSRVYAVLPLTDLAIRLGVSVVAAQTVLLRLSTEQSWPVRVDEDGMVRFPRWSDVRMDVSAHDRIESLLQLTRAVQNLDWQVASSHKYQTLLRKEKSKSGSKTNAARSLAGPRGVEDV
jgi:hypothetical protein